jgi:lipoate-protein ligase A
MAARMDSRSLYVGNTTEMRVPRHDTTLSLPAETPREALARDEALLNEVQPGGPWLKRGYVAATPAVVVGLGLWHRVYDIVDFARCAQAGIEVLRRRAGGGVVLVDANMVCGAICVPLPQAGIADDLTASYRWLGDLLASDLGRLGVLGARSVEVDEARADVHGLKSSADAPARWLQTTCYGALSPYEVVAGVPSAKVVGLAQVRRRHAALYQFGILLGDQSPLADLLGIEDDSVREDLRQALRHRTVGLADLLEPEPSASTLIERIARLSIFEAAWEASGATPSAP